MKLHNDFGTRWLFRPDPVCGLRGAAWFVAGAVFMAAMIPVIEWVAH